ncbi:MAG: hypothetical protein HZC55_13325 [Verrucomicrobia bacterium]|nr:hypothetical protein [Verrucomicrobiota bacterium]
MKPAVRHLFPLLLLVPALAAAEPRAARVLFDFESGTFAGWTQEGEEAFGLRPVDPAAEMLHAQPPNGRYRFAGWEGRYLVSHNITLSKRFGLRVTRVPGGRLVSDPFTIDRDFLTFKLGAVLNPGVYVALVLEPEGAGPAEATGRPAVVPVRTAYGNNKFDLVLRGWEVREYRQRRARLHLVADTGARVLFRVDHFVLTDTPLPDDVLYARSHWLDTPLLAPGKYHLMFDARQVGPAFWHASVVQGHDGRWHCFAEESKEANGYLGHANNLVYHASAADLRGQWSSFEPVFFRDRDRGETWLRDPTVVYDPARRLYVMTYWGSGRSPTAGPFGIHLATSRDGEHWERDARNPIFTHDFAPLNGAIVREGGRWVMLYSNVGDEAVPVDRCRLFARTSDNLREWSGPREIRVTSTQGQELGHSRPQAFQRGKEWFLLTNNRTSQQGRTRFLFTQVYTGPDLFSWDVERDYRGNLNVFDSSSVVIDAAGDWNLVHCHVTSGGPWIARLRFHDEIPRRACPVDWPGIPLAN